MLLSLQGVIVDGTTAILPAVNVTPTRQDIVVYQGVDTSIRVTITGTNATAIDITGYTGSLVIKDRLLPAEGSPRTTRTYTAALTTPAAGIMTFTIPGIDLKGLNLVGYWYDVFVTSPTAKRDEVVPSGTVTVWAAVGA